MTIALLVSGGLIGLILALVLGDAMPSVEKKITDWFSDATGRPRWFVLWVLILVLWIPGRFLLKHYFNWFNDDTDFILTTILWSVFPYLTELVLKSSTAQQTKLQTETLNLIQDDLERSERRENTMVALANKILDAIEDDGCSKGGE